MEGVSCFVNRCLDVIAENVNYSRVEINNKIKWKKKKKILNKMHFTKVEMAFLMIKWSIYIKLLCNLFDWKNFIHKVEDKRSGNKRKFSSERIVFTVKLNKKNSLK